MIIKDLQGSVLDSTATCILHQVNCQGKMNSGVAKAIRTKWPVVYDKYFSYWNENIDKNKLLGKVLPVSVSDTQKVLNLFGQNNYGYDGERYTSYDAIYDCLSKVRNYCEMFNITSIALPYRMSCDRGGGNWIIIMTMINEIFKYTDITIEIWHLEKN